MTIDEPTIAPRAGRAAAPRAASSGSLRLHLVTLLGVAYALSLWAVARSSDRPAPRRPERVAPAAPVEARPRAPRTAVARGPAAPPRAAPIRLRTRSS